MLQCPLNSYGSALGIIYLSDGLVVMFPHDIIYMVVIFNSPACFRYIEVWAKPPLNVAYFYNPDLYILWTKTL
jgi:hypothetical protein